MYRELAYVERCVCDEPAVAGCASCGRARCGYHLTNGLCMRCAEAIRRELDKRSSGRFIASMTTGVIFVFVPLIVHSAAGFALGAMATAGAFVGLRKLQRRWLIKRMGPALSASKGELPPPPRTSDPYPERTAGMAP